MLRRMICQVYRDHMDLTSKTNKRAGARLNGVFEFLTDRKIGTLYE